MKLEEQGKVRRGEGDGTERDERVALRDGKIQRDNGAEKD